MGGLNRQTDSECERDREVSRRGFLTTSSALLLADGQHLDVDSTSARRASIEFEDLTLSRDDLVAPEQDTYAELVVDLDNASLVQFLRETITGFGVNRMSASGFVASRNYDAVPFSIESAVFELSVRSGVFSEVAAGIATWVEMTRRTNDVVKSVDVTWETNFTKWSAVTHDDWLDAIRVRRIGDTMVVTSASGDSNTAFDSSSAVDYYAQIVRNRVSEG